MSIMIRLVSMATSEIDLFSNEDSLEPNLYLFSN